MKRPVGRPRKYPIDADAFKKMQMESLTNKFVNTPPIASQHQCAKCQALESMVEFMKLQNRELQEKLLSLVPPAMDSYMRLQMSQSTQMRPEAARGIMPESMAIEDDGLDAFFNEITGQGKQMPGVPGRGRPV